MRNMQIVILAAGRGTRMGQLTDKCPKPMLKIKNKPILAYKVEALPKEIDEVIFVIGYLGDQIKEYFGEIYDGRKISYVVQENLNGGAAAVHLAKEILKDDFLVMMADDLYVRQDVASMMKHDLAILGLEVQNPKLFGIISLNEKGNLKEVIEKPEIPGPAFANVALYKLNKKFFDYDLIDSGEGKGEFGLPQTLASMAKDFQIAVEKATGWFPIGNPEALKNAEEVIDRFI